MHSRSKRTITVRQLIIMAALLIVTMVSAVTFTKLAFASVDPSDCKTVTTHLVNRPDNGHGTPSLWALDTMTRTVTVCHGPQPEPSDSPDETALNKHYPWHYTATLKDAGTFVTKGGATGSPNDGKPLTAGTKGTVNGTATYAEFVSGWKWDGWQGADYDGKTYSDSEPGTTGDWVKMLFSGGKVQTSITDYKWVYKTCQETWIDSSTKDNDDGQSDSAGDITGKACPSPTPTKSAPPTVSQSPVVASLPVTGSNITGTVVAVGGGFAVLGVVLFLYGRRRRSQVRFTA